MLIQSGASIHEVVGNKTISTLNLHRDDYDPQAFPSFIRLLLLEGYHDFSLVDTLGFSAVSNSIRSRGCAIEAIDLLASGGVDFTKVFPDGRTVLHIAAEMSINKEVLEHLYTKYNVTDVNKQDRWGLSPLHYAIFSSSNRLTTSTCRKARFLLEKGADPTIRGHVKSLSPQLHSHDLVTTCEYSAALGPKVYEKFLKDLRVTGNLGMAMEEGDDEDEQFHDAQEHLI